MQVHGQPHPRSTNLSKPCIAGVFNWKCNVIKGALQPVRADGNQRFQLAVLRHQEMWTADPRNKITLWDI
jgi:hypothetical protein